MTKIIKLTILVSFLVSISFAKTNEEISQISIFGNERIQISTIKSYLGLKEGQKFSPKAKNKSIRDLYETSFFEDININFSDGILKVNVKENPLISKVSFIGTSKIKPKVIEKELLTTQGGFLRKDQIKADVEKIKEICRRYGSSSFTEVKVETKQGGNNTVEVTFQVIESSKRVIKDIFFIGNYYYSNSELKSVIVTKESKWFNFFLGTNGTYIYDSETVELDKYLLSEFYKAAGFRDFNIISVSTSFSVPKKEKLTLTYSITEGTKYQLGDVKIYNRVNTIDTKQVEKYICYLKKKAFHTSTIELTVKKITNFLVSQGQLVKVNYYLEVNRKDKLIDVVIVINQADKTYIDKINITGNLKTSEHVIRRQLKISEGDLYHDLKLREGEKNIQSLPFFDEVIIEPVSTEQKDRCDINIKVKEKSSVNITLGLGNDPASSEFYGGFFQLSESNLFGSGKQLSTNVKVDRKSISYDLGITDPYFLDKDLSLSIGFFKLKSTDYDNSIFYPKRVSGIKTSIDYDLTDNLSHEVKYFTKKEELMCNTEASNFVKNEMGDFKTHGVGHSVIYNKIDNTTSPKNGYSIFIDQEFAGLGRTSINDIHYLKHGLKINYFKSFFDNKYTLKLTATAGNISGNKIGISNRFFLEDTLRGFSEGVGPKDEKNNIIGGRKYYTLSSEVIFPLLVLERLNLSTSIFSDLGSLQDPSLEKREGFHNDKKIRLSAGFGFRLATKFLPPIRVYFGFPIKKFEKQETYHIQSFWN